MALLADVAICLPLLGLLLPALLVPSVPFACALLVIGPVYGVGVGVVLRRRAVRRWRDRAPEVLELLATTGRN